MGRNKQRRANCMGKSKGKMLLFLRMIISFSLGIIRKQAFYHHTSSYYHREAIHFQRKTK